MVGGRERRLECRRDREPYKSPAARRELLNQQLNFLDLTLAAFGKSVRYFARFDTRSRPFPVETGVLGLKVIRYTKSKIYSYCSVSPNPKLPEQIMSRSSS